MAPLVVTVTKQLVGPTMLVTNGTKTIAIAPAELLRPWEAQQLSIVTRLDGSELVPAASWGFGRYSGAGLIELGSPISAGPDVAPLDLGSVCATVETRGAPSALVTVTQPGAGYAREVIPVYVDAVDAGGMSDDVLARLATPMNAAHADHPIEGAILFSWFPPDPVLGRRGEVLAMALAYTYRQRAFQPRGTPAIAELVGLDDVGRALISEAPAPERPELHEVVGEVEARETSVPVIEGPDEYRQKRERKN